MSMMNAALVTSFYEPPHVQRIPTPTGLVVQVLAAAVHPRVRAMAAGSECERLGDPPLVPGIDGVGRRDDGTLVYFLAASELFGTMAEFALVEPGRWVALPDNIDPLQVAATMHPAVSARLGVDPAGDGADPQTAAYEREMAFVIEEISTSDITWRGQAASLGEIERAWLLPERPGTRTVIVP